MVIAKISIDASGAIGAKTGIRQAICIETHEIELSTDARTVGDRAQKIDIATGPGHRHAGKGGIAVFVQGVGHSCPSIRGT